MKSWRLPQWLDTIIADLDIEGRALDEHPGANSTSTSELEAASVR